MIVLHHNDIDGRAAGAIIRLQYPNENIKFVEMNYNKKVPFEQIEAGETVFIVDFSLQNPGDWETLLSITGDVHWIDHHATAIEKEGIQNRLPGLRRTDGCGALLTWMYIKGQDVISEAPEQAPEALRLVDDWDRWVHSDERTKPFKYGLEMQDHGPEALIWPEMLGYGGKAWIERLVEEGLIAMKYENQANLDYMKAYGFESSIDGHLVYVMNKARVSSLAFDKKMDEYPICACFVYDGALFTVSLYTARDDIHVGNICVARGGGGHPKAAGFQTTEIPFLRVE